ncbi:MAG: hypothetical protein AB7E34_11110 [Acidaminococcaceae bacterium]
MQRYINQLIEDLHEIAQIKNQTANTEPDRDDEALLKHFQDIENYLHGEEVPISEITGILPEQLPPPEMLNESQQAQLSVELENFLENYTFALDFPHNYPNHLRYPFIRNFWTEKHIPMQCGTSHIEFCEYDETNCPFQGYCNSCNQIDIEDNYLDSYSFEGSNEMEIE